MRDESLRARRRAEGRPEDIDKVTFTASGRLDPSMNFFTQGAGRKFVFSTRPLPQLAGVAEVVVPEESLTAQLLVTELEKRGIERLLVEGGPRTLRLFARAGLIDTLRLAVNRSMRLGVEADAPRLCFDEGYLDVPHTDAMLDDRMEIRTWRFHPNTREEDLCLLRRAIELSLQSPPSPTSYRVGAVVRTARGELFTGYTHETSPTHHAEQEAVAKALAAGAELRGAAMYSSMEPCSRRSSEPESCSAMMLRLGFARGGLRPLRARLLRLLPRRAQPARRGCRRARLPFAWRRGCLLSMPIFSIECRGRSPRVGKTGLFMYPLYLILV